MHNFFLHKNILIFRRFFNSANRYFKINRHETTAVSLILNKHKNDTIYYSDSWNDDVTLVNKNGKYKRISWHDDRFYVKDIRTNRIQINHNYIEIVILDYATFVVCQSDSLYQIVEPITVNNL